MTAHIPDKGEVMVREYGLYSHTHRGVSATLFLFQASALRNCGKQ
ncbi:MAG: hypothetical protein JSV46_07325 [Candidatus Aminicenantes bacterium]|nr:MAG: hypothetical protein JSV46_07325 [Candidatus Aminicenantes bacterium]